MVSATLFSSASDEWSTPQELFDEMNERWVFTLDAAASHENAKCPHYFTKDGEFLRDSQHMLTTNDGLTGQWGPDNWVWLNPPYGRGVGKWVEKAWVESLRNHVTMLLPARTDTKWFHEFIWSTDTVAPRRGIRLELLKGRLKFGGCENPAPFPSMVVHFARY